MNYKHNDLTGTLSEIKTKFKDALSKESWIEMEEEGILFTINDVQRTMIVGSKWGRVAMHSNLLTMKDNNETIMWKFKFHEWLEVKASDLYAMHDICNRFIAENSRWEYELNTRIDKAIDEEELQTIANNVMFVQTKQYVIKNGVVHES